ncbi:MAG: histidinol-phosphatase HisJ family protein [Clostridiales bacterium]|nr:histidinol-phosphatase HisJ family protein [Clostridiales bacterium]
MYLTDYHLHTLCSPDGSAPLADMAAAAMSAGMDEICVTDHCDLLDLDGKPDGAFQWGPIEEQLRLARPQFQGRLPIRMGLELGEAWADPELARRIIRHPELDFVIGSAHNLSAEAGGKDFYFVQYDSEETCYAALDDYFRSLEILTGLNCYDVLGHIIYPLRYMNLRDGNHVTLERYFPRIEKIFRAVVSQDKAIEVNTCRGQTVEDWRDTLALYRDCGGKLVTLGSDAHQPADVGAGIAQAGSLIREYGLQQAVYERHQPKTVK